MDVAADARADAVKFQTFKADRLVTRAAPRAEYQRRATGDAASQHAMLAALELSERAHELLWQHCAERGIEFMSTPFDPESALYLKRLGVRRLKVPSGEVTNLPLLRLMGGLGLPVILSTGMADLTEVEAAVTALQGAGCRELSILHCVSNYPATPEATNLRAMDTLAYAVGLSDHTEGTTIAVAAVARGATILEKHFTLDRGLPGPDHQASLEPGELKALVRAVRDVTAALGDGVKRPVASELPIRDVARKSLVTTHDLPAGATLRAGDLVILRPGTGLPPARLDDVIGRRTARAIPAQTPLTESMLLPPEPAQ